MKRIARMPPWVRRSSSASETPGFTTATPRVSAAPSSSIAASVTELSSWYALGCTITVRKIPRRSCTAR